MIYTKEFIRILSTPDGPKLFARYKDNCKIAKSILHEISKWQLWYHFSVLFLLLALCGVILFYERVWRNNFGEMPILLILLLLVIILLATASFVMFIGWLDEPAETVYQKEFVESYRVLERFGIVESEESLAQSTFDANDVLLRLAVNEQSHSLRESSFERDEDIARFRNAFSTLHAAAIKFGLVDSKNAQAYKNYAFRKMANNSEMMKETGLDKELQEVIREAMYHY